MDAETDTIEDMDAAWEQAGEAVAAMNSEGSEEATEEETSDSAEVAESEDAEDEGSDGETEEPADLEEAVESSGDEEESGPDKIQQLEELAKELGFEFDGEKVQNSHWVKLRKQDKARAAKFTEKAEAKAAELRQEAERLETQYRPYAEMKRAAESGDFDTLAKNLGFPDFTAMQMGHINGVSRESVQVAEMRRQMEQFQEQQRQLEQQTKQAQVQAAETQYRTAVTGVLSKYQQTAAIASEPAVLDAIIQIQRDSADIDGLPTVSVEEAAKSILDQMKAEYDRLGSRLSIQRSNSSEGATGAASPKSAEKKPKKTVSHTQKSDASGSQDDDDLDEDAWIKKWVKQ